jgi:hypothetical protein
VIGDDMLPLPSLAQPCASRHASARIVRPTPPHAINTVVRAIANLFRRLGRRRPRYGNVAQPRTRNRCHVTACNCFSGVYKGSRPPCVRSPLDKAAVLVAKKPTKELRWRLPHQEHTCR